MSILRERVSALFSTRGASGLSFIINDTSQLPNNASLWRIHQPFSEGQIICLLYPVLFSKARESQEWMWAGVGEGWCTTHAICAPYLFAIS